MSESHNAISCSTCPFYVQQNERQGICRHNPPQVFLMPGPPDLAGQPTLRTQSIWPSMGALDWCGRHPMFGVAVPIDRRLAANAEGEA